MSFTLAALLVTSSVALAQSGWGGRGHCDSPGWHHPEKPRLGQGMGMRDGRPGVQMILAAADDIKLTDEQKARLEKMLVDFQLAKVDQRARVKKAGIRLRALKRDKSANENEVLSAIDEVARMKADLHKMRYRHQREIHNLLTDEQIDKLKELRKVRMKKFKGRHGGMGPGGAGMGFGFPHDSDN
jgi:Spy/CpxP family protein refolding chaperone